MAKSPVYYTSPPCQCDLCRAQITESFSDARLPRHGGTWANVCKRCALMEGVSYGTGRGQHYVRQADGRYLKVEG